ncbi:MAG: hypothetical protein H5T69_13955 [Chloroflexi bacterium]|nr:hypothetical protein [Chloroflexota bacterium]
MIEPFRAWCPILLLILLALCLVMISCARPKPAVSRALPPIPSSSATPAEPTPPSPVLRLKEPIGAHVEIIAGEELVRTIENCASTNSATQEIEASVEVSSFLHIELPGALPEPAPQEEGIKAFIHHTYALPDSVSAPPIDRVAVPIPGGSRAVVHMAWHYAWDRNTVEIAQDGAVLAELPVRALIEASLEVTDVTIEPCATGSPQPQTSSTPEIVENLGTSVELQATVALTSESEVGPTVLPGSDEAIALVRGYLQAIQEGRFRDAYALLHPRYQTAHPFEIWRQGYAPVTGLEIRIIEAIRIDRYTEEVRVGLTLTTQKQGQTLYSDWSATYRVVVARGVPPFQRAISDIRMRALGVG